jgi:hypothetical protein
MTLRAKSEQVYPKEIRDGAFFLRKMPSGIHPLGTVALILL